MNLYSVKSMVRGGIQTILSCLLTNSDSNSGKNRMRLGCKNLQFHSSEIPVFTSSNDLVQSSIHLGFNFFFFYIKCRILVFFEILIRLLNFHLN